MSIFGPLIFRPGLGYASPGMRIAQPMGGAAAGDWWDPSNEGLCVWAAYQPKGAASLAASYTDLTGNGNNAGVGVAPTWDAVNGWKFDGLTQYLTTTFVPQNDQSQTAIVQFTNVTNTGYPFGVRSLGPDYMIARPDFVTTRQYRHGNTTVSAGLGTNVNAGNMAIAGGAGYYNGAADVVLPGFDSVPIHSMYIGCVNVLGVAGAFGAVYIQAFALYDCTLTAPQVLAVATAMAAL